MFNWLKNRRRRKILSQKWPESWSQYLEQNVRLSRHLSESEKSKFKKCIQIFVAEKSWEGCDGLELTDEIRVTIAAGASLLLIGTDDFYFENVQTILVFPGSVSREMRQGMLHGGNQRHSGEAYQGGPIVLSWQDAVHGGRSHGDGSNVVVHEFAHALDGLDGDMGGSLMFDDAETTERWEQVRAREFASLVHARDSHHSVLMDYYGATNPAEFFAVATETFFELPNELKREHPELFELLASYFHLDPTRWQA